MLKHTTSLLINAAKNRRKLIADRASRSTNPETHKKMRNLAAKVVNDSRKRLQR